MAASGGNRNFNIPDKNTVWEDTFIEAIKSNYRLVEKWTTWKEEHVKLKKTLADLPNKLSHPGVIPFGSRALVKAKIIHTNEVLSCIGDGYFIKQSAKQAIDLCDRRIKESEKMLEDFEKERKLLKDRQTLPKAQEAFASEDQDEIVEEYDEEKEIQWRARHREMEKKYRQELAELRKKREEGVPETEDDLFRKLDLLELEEEMNDELDRLDAEIDSDESDGGGSDESEGEEKGEKQDSQEKSLKESNSQISGPSLESKNDLLLENTRNNFKGFQKVAKNSPSLEPGQVAYGFTDSQGNEWQKPVVTNAEEENSSVSSLRKPRKSVSFASEEDDLGTAVNEELDPNIFIRFKHSNNEFQEPPAKQVTEKGDIIQINSPTDIYRHFAHCMSSSGPKSILKRNSYQGGDSVYADASPHNQQIDPSVGLRWQDDDSAEDSSHPIRDLSDLPPVLQDVVETNTVEPVSSQPRPTEPGRRVSRFKAARSASQGHR